MIVNPQVPLHRMVMSLAQAMDCVHREVNSHQLRVAYIATSVARQLGFKGPPLLDVFLAAAFHDIGLLRSERRMQAVHLNRLEGLLWHAEVGYQLLRDVPIFADAAELVRCHHTYWNDGRGAEHDGRPVPLASHIIHLGDEVDRRTGRSQPVLPRQQEIIQGILGLSGRQLHPECVRAFEAVAQPESFWLDIVSDRIHSVLPRQIDWPTLTLDEAVIEPIACMLSHLVDASSSWTALHSAGVTATAVALAQRLGFAPREENLLRVAGYLHDLGKLTIPSSILDNSGRLSADETFHMKQHVYHTFRILDSIGGMPQVAEWASFHHERLDGRGYPFRHKGRDLTLGSRIMAVADVFSAITEDRPYRVGMDALRAQSVLETMVADGGIDGDVVKVLKSEYETINEIRRVEQAQYARKHQQVTQLAIDQVAMA